MFTCLSMKMWQKKCWFFFTCTGTFTIFYMINVYFEWDMNIRDSIYQPRVTLNHCENIALVNNQSHICRNETDSDVLIVVVATQFTTHHRRHMIRSTWGSLPRYHSMATKVVFFAGLTLLTTENLRLQAEAAKYRDMVIINQKENYFNLTQKSVVMLRWATEFCSKARYILKTDDDCFNDLAKFVDFVSNSWLPTEFIAGHCMNTAKPIRLINHRFFISNEYYPHNYYPRYCMGAAYIVSRKAAIKLLKYLKHVKYLPFEDIYITGFARLATGITAISMPGILIYTPDVKLLKSCQFLDGVRTIHGVHLARWQYLWNLIQPEVGLCKKT